MLSCPRGSQARLSARLSHGEWEETPQGWTWTWGYAKLPASYLVHIFIGPTNSPVANFGGYLSPSPTASSVTF